MLAKLQAIASAVRLVIDHSFPQVVVESDCPEAVALVNSAVRADHPLHSILTNIGQGVAFHGNVVSSLFLYITTPLPIGLRLQLLTFHLVSIPFYLPLGSVTGCCGWM